MIEESIQKLTLDRSAIYQITVLGKLDESWSDWVEGTTILVKTNDVGDPITTLKIMADQAALLGLLRRLYSFGIPLISVKCLMVK